MQISCDGYCITGRQREQRRAGGFASRECFSIRFFCAVEHLPTSFPGRGRPEGNIEAATMLRMAEEIPNVVMDKERARQYAQIMEIAAASRKNFHFSPADAYRPSAHRSRRRRMHFCRCE